MLYSDVNAIISREIKRNMETADGAVINLNGIVNKISKTAYSITQEFSQHTNLGSYPDSYKQLIEQMLEELIHQQDGNISQINAILKMAMVRNHFDRTAAARETCRNLIQSIEHPKTWLDRLIFWRDTTPWTTKLERIESL